MAQLGFLARHAGQLAIAHTEAAGQRRNTVRRINFGSAALELVVYPGDSFATGHAVVIHTRHHHGKHVAGINGAFSPPMAIAGKDVLGVETAMSRQTLSNPQRHAYGATIALAGSQAIEAATDALLGERRGLGGRVSEDSLVHWVLLLAPHH